MVKFKKLYIILGISGCRKDFATGWLGTLPNFVNTRWYISMPTGVSFSDSFFIKQIDAEPNWTFKTLLENHGMMLSPNSNLNLAISCHGLNLIENLKGLNDDEYEIININVSDESMPKVFWEQFAKNFLRYNNSIDQLHNDNFLNRVILKYTPNYKDYHNITNKEQIEIIENLYPKYDSSDASWVSDVKNRFVLQCNMQDKVSMKYINYEELFVSGGSKKLCEILNLGCSDINHKFWDAMLPFADTPDEIEFLDRLWKKSDYIK